MWNYVVTAQKPTAVTHSVTGYWTGPSDQNLIIRYTCILEATCLICLKILFHFYFQIPTIVVVICTY